MTEFAISGESWFLGEWVDDERQVEANITITSERAAWLRVRERMGSLSETVNRVAQVHPGTNYYGRGEQMSSEDFMLIQVGENDFNLNTKRTGSIPVILKRVSGRSINNSHFIDQTGMIEVWTYPLDDYPLTISLKAISPWASDQNNMRYDYDLFGAMTLDGAQTWQPDSKFKAKMLSHHQLLLETNTYGNFTMEPFV